MKNSPLLSTALLALGLVFATTGCSTFLRSPATTQHILTYALVVSVNDGQPPTEAQWATLQQRFATALGARGYALVSDPALADRIIHVRFSPDADDPSTGTAYVVSIKANPALLASTTSTSMLPASFGGLGYNGSYGYGYNDYSYSDNYYTPSYVVYRPGPHRPDDPASTTHPTHPADHPPGTTPTDHPGHHDHPPINFVGNYPTHIAPSPDNGHRPHPRSDDPSYSRSDSNYTRSDSNYRSSSSSYSSYDGPSTSYSSSASSSAPTMSAPSSWSSSGSSSSSSSYSPPSDSSSSSSSGSSSSSYSAPTESASGHDVQPR